MHWIDQVMICSMQGIKHLVFDLGPNLRRVYRFRYIPRIENEGLTERAIILCKLNKSLLENSKSLGIHRQKKLYSLKNLCI